MIQAHVGRAVYCYRDSDWDPPEPELSDDPTYLSVSSRQPIRVLLDGADVHVRMRWDGKDHLLAGSGAPWKIVGRLSGSSAQPIFSISEPIRGRFSLLISSMGDWQVGQQLTFEVTANGPKASSLRASFTAIIVEKIESPEGKRPRLVTEEIASGASRRPPYALKYISRDSYDDVLCWGGESWSDGDPGCFLAPTERTPLTLVINQDMAALREYRRYLTRSYTEAEVERRITKYTSHIAFHLYQMFQTADSGIDGEDINAAESRRRAEIQRVAMTLIKLMEVSR